MRRLSDDTYSNSNRVSVGFSFGRDTFERALLETKKNRSKNTIYSVYIKRTAGEFVTAASCCREEVLCTIYVIKGSQGTTEGLFARAIMQRVAPLFRTGWPSN